VNAVARRERTEQGQVPPRWPWLFRLFRWYAHSYAAKHLHAVRVLRSQPPPKTVAGPMIVVMNHPSWWDAILNFVLSNLWDGRVNWGPMESHALAKYKFLSRTGLFGVETGTARGAVEFLRTARAILTDPRATLWLYGQGRFADVRERPLQFRSGVGHLAERLEAGTILPVAVEYTFWGERTPEALVAFSEPFSGGGPRTAREWTADIERELERAQNMLARAAMTRDPNQFEVLIRGRAGVGGVYDLWRRFKAFVTGRRFRPEHCEADEC
jgi:1-acyl-sn-glycerol-3-phosphate acyltransferase